jgi:hypothetical protein
MAQQRRTLGVLILLLTVLFAAMPGMVYASFVKAKLSGLVRMSDAIVVAKVEAVKESEGLRVAEATVLQSAWGLKAEQKFAYIASPTWRCDTSKAVQGEQVLLFLHYPDRERVAADLSLSEQLVCWEVFQTRYRPEAFFLIANWGQGRFPLLRYNDQDYLDVAMEPIEYCRDNTIPFHRCDGVDYLNLLIYKEKGLRDFPHPDPKKQTSRLVLLDDVLKRARGLKLIPLALSIL